MPMPDTKKLTAAERERLIDTLARSIRADYELWDMYEDQLRFCRAISEEVYSDRIAVLNRHLKAVQHRLFISDSLFDELLSERPKGASDPGKSTDGSGGGE